MRGGASLAGYSRTVRFFLQYILCKRSTIPPMKKILSAASYHFLIRSWHDRNIQADIIIPIISAGTVHCKSCNGTSPRRNQPDAPLVMPTACLTNTSQGTDGIHLASEPEHRDKNNAAPKRGSVTDECAEHTDDNQRQWLAASPIGFVNTYP
jgi:hypothetical protein